MRSTGVGLELDEITPRASESPERTARRQFDHAISAAVDRIQLLQAQRDQESILLAAALDEVHRLKRQIAERVEVHTADIATGLEWRRQLVALANRDIARALLLGVA